MVLVINIPKVRAMFYLVLPRKTMVLPWFDLENPGST